MLRVPVLVYTAISIMYSPNNLSIVINIWKIYAIYAMNIESINLIDFSLFFFECLQ